MPEQTEESIVSTIAETERLIIRHFYNRPGEDQLLVTFGLGIVFVEVVRFFFGSLSQRVPPPDPLVGITNLGFVA